jgi:Cu2+-exporting ATPase
MTAAICPACSIVDAPIEQAQRLARHTKRTLSLPDITCAGCIKGVEKALRSNSMVSDARVNFSLKRATVFADPDLSDADLIVCLSDAGYAAFSLNETVLNSSSDGNLKALGLRIGVSGFAMMNVMLLSVAVWSGAADSTRDLFHWISAAIAMPATIFSAQPFFKSAWAALRVKRMNMDVPIALAILLALALSLYETSMSGHHAYFDAALSLTFFLLIGRFLDQRIKGAARSAAKDLAALEPATVTLAQQGELVEVPIGDLKKDDVMFLSAGSRLPADGEMAKGDSLIDLSFITGECDPIPSMQGMTLPAGAINLTGPIWVRATHVGADTSLQRIADLIEQAETARNTYTSLADRAASIYAPAVHVLALAAFVFWAFFSGDIRFAINVAVAVLIITCPCALGLAVPAVATAINSKLFAQGIILKGETALERLAEIDVVVFDKTGTLSEMRFDANQSKVPSEHLPALKSLAELSNHPLSKSLAKGLKEIKTVSLKDIEEIAGFGVAAKLEDQEIALRSGVAKDGAPASIFEIDGDEYPLVFEEQILSGSADMISTLAEQGYETILLSGDTKARVAKAHVKLGTMSAHGEMTPMDKAEFVSGLIARGKKPLMVGDGLNDTAALAHAHASLAPSTALDISRNAADTLLIKSTVEVIPQLLSLTKMARARMLQNFRLAIAYNLIAVPVAFCGLVTPLVAALLMSVSSLTVILNAARFPK